MIRFSSKETKEEQSGFEASTPMDDAANNIECIAWCAYGIERIREDLSTHSFGSILRRGWANTKEASRCGISGLRDKPSSGSSEEHKEWDFRDNNLNSCIVGNSCSDFLTVKLNFYKLVRIVISYSGEGNRYNPKT